MTPQQKLERAVVSLLQSDPFWAALVLRLRRVEADEGQCQIMATDGRVLLYNPQAVSMMPLDQLKTALAHEAAHCALHHVTRAAGKDLDLANQAADYVTNLVLADGGYAEIPGWLLDRHFQGMEFEKVYAILASRHPRSRQQNQQNGGGSRQAGGGGSSGQPQGQFAQAPVTPGGFGQILPCPEAEAPQIEQEWRIAVEQAAAVARAAGNLPGGIARMVEELRRPKLDWRSILRQFISNCVPQDFTWARPNKRTLSQGIYLPGVKKENLGQLVISIDTSGSITQQQLQQFADEIRSIHQDLKPERITVLYHDTQVQAEEHFEPQDSIDLHPKGGGGTDFRPVFDWVANSDSTPACLVMLTDMDGPMPTTSPDYPVLWVSTEKATAPFGEVVYMEW